MPWTGTYSLANVTGKTGGLLGTQSTEQTSLPGPHR